MSGGGIERLTVGVVDRLGMADEDERGRHGENWGWMVGVGCFEVFEVIANFSFVHVVRWVPGRWCV